MSDQEFLPEETKIYNLLRVLIDFLGLLFKVFSFTPFENELVYACANVKFTSDLAQHLRKCLLFASYLVVKLYFIFICFTASLRCMLLDTYKKK